MKRIIALVLTLATVLCLFAACTENPAGTTIGKNPTTNTNPTTPTNKPTEPTQPNGPTKPIEPEDPWADYETITIAEALELCEQFVDAPSADRYYIRATIVSVDSATYGQLTIKDETGEIMVYGTYSDDGSIRYDAMTEKPVAGDEILIYGTLQNYKGNTKEVQNARLIDFISGNGGEDEPVELPADGTVLTIAEALALAAKLESGKETTQRYYITATVDSITNAAYGEMSISDGTGTISVYNSKNADGTVDYKNMEDKPYKGDTVKLYCTLQNYNGKYEIKSAWITEFTHGESDYNEADYTDMTIDEARDVATGTKVRVSGVVARITFANGYIPSGFILVDGTNSIYVYDGDVAARVAIGNTVTVAASKTYWILESEVSSASKYGYAGCNQLENAYLLSNDEGTSDFDKSWITDSTVKEIMDTPASTDITTTIFKVTALIKRVDGNGFINYYIDDLDGVTGSYAYTQCSGGDFAWLDAFDGKICTVYLMALNAKSSSSGCLWRFLPIEVIDEGFDISSVNIPEHVVKYFAVDQFLAEYTGDPTLELITSVDSELLNFAGAALSYVSSNTDIVYFEETDGKLIMHCGAAGTATVTVTGTYNGQTYSEDVTVVVSETVEVDSITVDEAINTAVGETVTVMGIVGPSLVNRDGFYLIDETGIIAITTSTANIGLLEIGQKVVLTGLRDKFHNGTGNHAGQIAITNCEIVANYYGNYDYCDSFFITGKTLADIVALDITEDHSTSVYVVKANIEYIETAFYTTLNVTYNGTTLKLYMSGAGQYSWLQAFAGQEVTLEIAPCNWNNKTDEYRGCVLAVILEDGTKVVNSLNFDKY